MGIEKNFNNNTRRRELKYLPLLTDFASDYNQIKFPNLSISYLGIFGNSSDSFRKPCIERGINNSDLNFIISKISTINSLLVLQNFTTARKSGNILKSFFRPTLIRV